MVSLQSSPAWSAWGAATPMSSAEERDGTTAVVRISVGRKPGAVPTNPRTSRSAVVSAIYVTWKTSSRISLCPRVPSPGAQHNACDPLMSNIRLHNLQRIGWQVDLAPNRSRAAAIKVCESSVRRERGSTVHSNFDETVSSRRSLRRWKSASLLGCSSKWAKR